MKIKLPPSAPASGEAAEPKSLAVRLLGATPVVMTVLATLLAGLSNSEMTQAQYDRALAAQQQSRTGDQWGFFQAKRQRGAFLRSSLELLQATADVEPFDAEAVRRAAGLAGSEPAVDVALRALERGEPDVAFQAVPLLPDIEAARLAHGSGKPDTEIVTLLRGTTAPVMTEAIRRAQDAAREVDARLAPAVRGVDQLERALAAALGRSRDTVRPVWRSFTAARWRWDAARYDVEAQQNRSVAELLELQVRMSNASAYRHHLRSQRFFLGMLGAQVAVILASLALAAQRRNLVWVFAAVLGLAALGFGVYVYLYI